MKVPWKSQTHCILNRWDLIYFSEFSCKFYWSRILHTMNQMSMTSNKIIILGNKKSFMQLWPFQNQHYNLSSCTSNFLLGFATWMPICLILTSNKSLLWTFRLNWDVGVCLFTLMIYANSGVIFGYINEAFRPKFLITNSCLCWSHINLSHMLHYNLISIR